MDDTFYDKSIYSSPHTHVGIVINPEEVIGYVNHWRLDIWCYHIARRSSLTGYFIARQNSERTISESKSINTNEEIPSCRICCGCIYR